MTQYIVAIQADVYTQTVGEASLSSKPLNIRVRADTPFEAIKKLEKVIEDLVEMAG